MKTEIRWMTLALAGLLPLVATAADPQPQANPQAPPTLDAASQEALMKTQQLLTDPTLRNQAVAKDPAAQQWANQVNDVTGHDPANREALYKVATQIFTDITNKSGGDPNKMMMLLEKAKTDPEGFFNSLTPDQKAQIQAITSRMPAAQGQTPAAAGQPANPSQPAVPGPK